MGTQSAERTEELLLYIAAQSRSDPAFGAIKLNKILFTIDFIAYGLWGHPITHFKHIRQRLGPTPAPTQFLPMRERMIREGRARLDTELYYGKPMERFVPLDTPRMSDFDDVEKNLIDDVMTDLRPANATDLSNWTHSLVPWLVTKNGDELPYYTIYSLKKRPIDKESMEWAEAIVREIKADRADA